jgi:transposase InsO family protein
MDCTAERELQKRRLKLVEEYRLAQQRQHPNGWNVTQLAQARGVYRQDLWDWSSRLAAQEDSSAVLPGKRGPKCPANKTPESVSQKVLQLASLEGYDSERLKANHPELPSARTIRRLLKPVKPRTLKPPVLRYEKAAPGDLAHIDLKKLPNVKGQNPKEKYYLAGVLDDYSRLVYQEKLPDKQAETVSAFWERARYWFKTTYQIEFKALLSDNGTEFTTHHVNSRYKHVFEQTLACHQVKHKYTQPYRPQTNGKIERYWRTWQESAWQPTAFENWTQVEQAIKQSQQQYNQWRKHGGIGYQTPQHRLRQWQEGAMTVYLAVFSQLLSPDEGAMGSSPKRRSRDLTRLLLSREYGNCKNGHLRH